MDVNTVHFGILVYRFRLHLFVAVLREFLPRYVADLLSAGEFSDHEKEPDRVSVTGRD